jgi:hypothetical protein
MCEVDIMEDGRKNKEWMDGRKDGENNKGKLKENKNKIKLRSQKKKMKLFLSTFNLLILFLGNFLKVFCSFLRLDHCLQWISWLTVRMR